MTDLLPQLRARGWPPPAVASVATLIWHSGPMTLNITQGGDYVLAVLSSGNEPITLRLQHVNDPAVFLDPWRRHFVTSPRPDETEMGEVVLPPLPIYAARLARGSLSKHVRYLATIPQRNDCDDQRLHQLAEESAAFSAVVRAIDAALQS